MSKWFLESIEINGGFLPGFSLKLPRGLTCIIGPRGSGKSTLTEALRYGVGGSVGATKARLELIQANLGSNTLITIQTASDSSGTGYTIRRTYKQSASLITADGKSITTVDLDRGTFLPLDGYSSAEIEGIADESIGEKRRSLLDELRGEQLRAVHIRVAEHRRALDANADKVRSTERLIADLTEQVEEMGDVRARLVALPRSVNSDDSAELAKSTRQCQINQREIRNLTAAAQSIARYRSDLRQLAEKYQNNRPENLTVDISANIKLLLAVQESLASAFDTADVYIGHADDELARAETRLAEIRNNLAAAHAEQEEEHARLQEKNLAASQAIQERAAIEQAVAQLEEIEGRLTRGRTELKKLLEERKALKGFYLLERERISELREEVAGELQQEAGGKVRIRVLRNADNLNYQQMLMEGLRGARVRNQDEIVKSLMRLRPEELAQLIRDNDLEDFEEQMSFGAERSRKIMDAFRENIDPLELEVVTIDDRIRIELNVSTGAEPNFKDAAELSRGQKCTALLPILLARRDTPLVIDQPEDNLDNHFIYETVVETIRRLKDHRQMIFITHNANIPVLAEANLVVVLNSDGKAGFIERAGTLDECQNEIIDLLEGGREAFELRRQRYAK
jgi:energy-coupling factor transporter ATP-binding protein EcfA2